MIKKSRMKLKTLLSISYLAASFLIGVIAGRFTSEKKLPPFEVMRIQDLTEQHIEVLKEKIDSKFGEGFFEEMVMRKISEEETSKRKIGIQKG